MGRRTGCAGQADSNFLRWPGQRASRKDREPDEIIHRPSSIINSQGRFIVLDGPDGCGKSSQARMLMDWLHGPGRGDRRFPRSGDHGDRGEDSGDPAEPRPRGHDDAGRGAALHGRPRAALGREHRAGPEGRQMRRPGPLAFEHLCLPGPCRRFRRGEGRRYRPGFAGEGLAGPDDHPRRGSRRRPHSGSTASWTGWSERATAITAAYGRDS